MKKIIFLILISFIFSCYLYKEPEISCSSVSIPALSGWKSEIVKTDFSTIYEYKPYFVTEDLGYLIYPDSIFKTKNNGDTWTKIKFRSKYSFIDISFIKSKYWNWNILINNNR